MRKPRQLKVVAPQDTKLGRPTIMDRALAQRYGAAYVHLAAFAIDIDRVHQSSEHELPFAWEVFVTELQIRQVMDSALKDPTPMFEEMCLGILELPRPKHGAAAPYGSQFTFALYTALARGFVATRLGHCFASWRKPPVELIDEMNELDKDAGMTKRLVEHCLDAKLEQPLVAPVREALAALAERASHREPAPES